MVSHCLAILEDVTFELLGYDQNGKVVVIKYKGVYVIVDNGYLDWSCTVPPFCVTNDMDEIRWSRWVESMRKDVECTFGILKGRWQILKVGICLNGIDTVDKVWFTCCALHNWLLDIDGLSKPWDGGVCMSDWEGTLGDLDFNGIDEAIPNALARLSLNLDPPNYDSSGWDPDQMWWERFWRRIIYLGMRTVMTTRSQRISSLRVCITSDIHHCQYFIIV